jgi:hypothetical protein
MSAHEQKRLTEEKSRRRHILLPIQHALSNTISHRRPSDKGLGAKIQAAALQHRPITQDNTLLPTSRVSHHIQLRLPQQQRPCNPQTKTPAGRLPQIKEEDIRLHRRHIRQVASSNPHILKAAETH